MKRFGLVCLALVAALFAACTPKTPTVPTGPAGSQTEITLWTYPVGGWGNGTLIAEQLAPFQKAYPGIRVKVEVVDYTTGDARVEEAIAQGKAPDLILEGPERLVANWGARGLMADISDLWESAEAEQIRANVEAACHDADGHYYIYPMCMTTHCMAIDRDLFEKAGALQFVDEETHTWSTEDFFNAIAALRAFDGTKNVAAVYCNGQGGDQGTRALVTNLYGGKFTDAAHTTYTVNSEENIRALTELRETDGILFDKTLNGSSEIDAFVNGDLAMAFCWNISQEIEHTGKNGFDILPMAFPTPDPVAMPPELQGGIWGFGIFDNHDEARLDAAKKFIRFMMSDAQYSDAVLTSEYAPVRDIKGLYANDEVMAEYSVFNQYLGDFYQVTPGWANARTAWWKMLRSIGDAQGDYGSAVRTAVAEFSQTVAAKASA